MELSGRLPAHTFLDYTVAYLAVALVTSLTFGQLGPPYHDLPNFLEQLQQPNGPVVAFAIAGGICLSLGDIAMQYAVAFLGLSIGPPILNALTIIIGIILSYFLDGGINQAHLVFTGMACAAIAIGLGTAAHLTHPATKQQLATAAAKRRRKQAAAAAGGPETDQDPSTTSVASADCTAVLPPPSADQDCVASRDCTVTIPADAAVQQQPGALVSSSPVGGTGAAAPVAAAAPAAAVVVGGCEGSELQEELIKEPAPERSVDTSNMSVYLGLAIAIVGESRAGRGPDTSMQQGHIPGGGQKQCRVQRWAHHERMRCSCGVCACMQQSKQAVPSRTASSLQSSLMQPASLTSSCWLYLINLCLLHCFCVRC